MKINRRQLLKGSAATIAIMLLKSEPAQAEPASENFVPDLSFYTGPENVPLLYTDPKYIGDSLPEDSQSPGRTVFELYFALQTAILLDRAGVNVMPILKPTTDFMIRHQNLDGSFDRYKLTKLKEDGRVVRTNEQNLYSYTTADAGDVLSTFFRWALIKTAPRSGLNEEAQFHYDLAGQYLQNLQDETTGLYYALPNYRIRYSAGTAEDYGAFIAAANEFKIRGLVQPAKENLDMASVQKQAYFRHFVNLEAAQNSKLDKYRVAVEDWSPGFYPDAVAQLYPAMFGVVSSDVAKAEWKQWKSKYKKEWLEFGTYDFPWGIIALHAYNMGDKGTAREWVDRNLDHRRQRTWHFGEEMMLQFLAYKLDIPLPRLDKAPLPNKNNMKAALSDKLPTIVKPEKQPAWDPNL